MLEELFQSGRAGKAEETPEEPEVRLTRAYQSFWRLGEDDTMDAYHAALAEIRDAEATLPGVQVRQILKEASEAWHRETGRCPFCGGPNLHSPAEAIVEGAT